MIEKKERNNMGLDLFLYKASKTNNESTENSIRSYDEIPHPDMKSLAKKVKKEKEYIDWDKICKEFHTSEDKILGTSFGKNDFSFITNEGTEWIHIPNLQFNSQYCYKKMETVFEINIEEIKYQRKGIDEEGWKILKEIGNYNYCNDKKLIKKLTCHGLDKEFYKLMDKDVYFLAWW